MRRETKLIMLAAVTVLNHAARAATWYVDDDPVDGCATSHPMEDGSALYPFDAIQEALDAAADGDVIIVRPGTYTGSCNRDLDFHGKDLVLLGDGCDTTIIDCESLGRAFLFDDGEPPTAKVIDLKIINGYSINGGAVLCEYDSNPTFQRVCFLSNESTGDGGAVAITVAAPAFDECLFDDNVALSDGGAIYDLSGEMTATDCTVRYNDAGSRGGAIMMLSNADAVLYDNTFQHNTADRGGALAADNGSDPQVSLGLIASNQAATDAGALYVDRDSHPVLTGIAIKYNTAGGNGGALAVHDSAVTVTGCLLLENAATGDGGGLIAIDSVTAIANSLFDTNAAVNGGGLRADRGSISVERTDFRTNQANSGGGAYHAGSQDTLHPGTYKWCRFIGHDIGGLGGGLYLDAVDMQVHNSGFYGNVCNDGGGGIYVRDGSDLEVANTAFSCNQALLGSSGGGMRIRLDSVVKVANSTFSRNQSSSGNGGGMIVEDADVQVSNAIFWNNSDAGGLNCDAQIHSTGAGTLSVARSDVMDPTAACPLLSAGTNLSADPLFLDDDGPDDVCGTEDDDLRIDYGSPCIDRANNNAVPDDVLDIDDDADLGEPLSLDLGAVDRFVDDPDTADSGIAHVVVPTLPIADLGAYEYAPPPCPWDLNGDGVVDTGDLLALLAEWGAPYDTADFLDLIASWGPCP